MYKIILLFNNVILTLFNFLYKYFNFESLEDKFHNHKKNSQIMNKVKLEFEKENEFKIVKNNILNMIKNNNFLKKYDISFDSILNNSNNKLGISFQNKYIYIYFNHYFISGPTMFILLNKMVNSNSPKFLISNPFLGIIYLPFYLYDLSLLKKREFPKIKKQMEHIIIEKNINTKNKRCYLYLNILNKIYNSLQLKRSMIVALSLAFEELPYIKNNVGLIIINYELKDTIETLEQKLKNAYYQAYSSNLIINCPLPNIGNLEIRNYVDCIISSMYIKSDFDFKVAWNCSKLPIEQMYVGSVSILHSDNTMDINMCLNTCSKNYNNSYNYIDNYFE